MNNDTPFCNPCQSYHSTSQPCFDAATAPRATVTSDIRSRDIAIRASVEIADALSSAESGWRNKPTRHEIQGIIAKHCEAAPRATGETTVESALAELREMFPEAHFISVKEHAMYQSSINHLPQADIQIDNKGFRRATLADCMAQVRATHTAGSVKDEEVS